MEGALPFLAAVLPGGPLVRAVPLGFAIAGGTLLLQSGRVGAGILGRLGL